MSAGWQIRAAEPDDLPAIVELIRAEDLRYRGHTDMTLAGVQEQVAANPHFDAARDQVAAERDGELIAAAVLVPQTALINVHPDHDEQRLRVELLAWVETRQAELGRLPHRVAVPGAYTPAVDFLQRAGYSLERFYARMVRRFSRTGPPGPARLADGYRLRTIDPVADLVALHNLDDRAFRERPDYRAESLESYDRRHISFSQFEPAWSLLVETTDGEPAGSLIGWRPPDHPHGYVAVLAVDPDHRGRGLAPALLLSAFGAIHAAGLATAELHVASDNPRALDLYTGVAMIETERFDHYVRAP